MTGNLEILCDLVRRHATGPATQTPIPRVEMRLGDTRTEPLPDMYSPMICFVLQGVKKVSFGEHDYIYKGPSYLVVSVDLPVTGQIIEATPGKPYIAVSILLEPSVIASLLIDMPAREDDSKKTAVSLSPLTNDLLDPLVRLMGLLDRQEDIAILAPLAEREILYRLLLGEQGGILRGITLADSRLSQVRRAIGWIRGNMAEPLRIENLASHSGMSASTFHRHFKAVTTMSPLQYQKQIRLQEARRILLAKPVDVTQTAFAVGYESVSQFNREYARQFGQPPGRDAARLRGIS